MFGRLKESFPIFSGCVTFFTWLMIIGGIITWLVFSSNGDDLVGFLIGGSIAIAGGLLPVYYIITGLFYFAASDKGYRDIAYLVMPFFLGAVGYLLICALPDRGISTAIPVAEELPDL